MTAPSRSASPIATEVPHHPLVVVGLGASAGGITAIKEFFAHVQPQSGAAYVVVLHLSPDHDSKLAEVIQTTVTMPVTQVTTAVQLRPNEIYVISPNNCLEVADGVLTVSRFTGREQRRAPIDLFFRALAEAHGSRAVGVVFSGTGADGSAGLKRIKESSGLVLVQDPEEAQYDDMPRNSIATGLVDFVLPASRMPAKIAAYAERLERRGNREEEAASLTPDSAPLRDVMTLLRLRTGHDFSNYKLATMQRRVERRMNLHGVAGVEEYAALMRHDSAEPIALMKELLISVTSFFRDPLAWAVVEERVVPRLFANKGPHEQVRAWVAGCATGEEAYSVAMLLVEYAAGLADPPSIQVFATDLDQRAIVTARDGCYTAGDLADLSEERLQRFFQLEPRGYRVRRDLRDLVLFASHNVIKDPPFSHLDLITCRNLMIYLNRAVQDQIVETFHFALRPAGFLFVGTAESPDATTQLFTGFDTHAHIYEKRPGATRPALALGKVPVLSVPAQTPVAEPRTVDRVIPADLHLRLLEQYAPPSVVVTEDHGVVHMSERAGRYLQVRGGEPSRDLLALVHPSLRPDLRTALHQAASERTSVHVNGIEVLLDGKLRLLNLSVHPVLRDGDSRRGFFLVVFDEVSAGDRQPRDADLTLTSPAEPLMHQMEEELARTRSHLQTTVEQYETQVEEAKASNEELQAMNEELRSSAEELETSKEELQSVNEELTTVNQELKIKIEELSVTNNDFQNFINATDIGTIFLDRRLRVKFATPRARDVFNLVDADIGRLLSDITNRLQNDGIHDDVQSVLERLSTIERELQTDDNRWLMMRILPYRTSDNHIDGVVITFLDITSRREAELSVRGSEERLRMLIDSTLDYAIFSVSEDGTIDSWNPGATRMFGYPADEIVGLNFDTLFTPEDRAGGMPSRELAEARHNGRAADERYHVRKGGERFYCSGVTRRLGPGGIGFAKIARDLTAQRQSADLLEDAHAQLEVRVRERTSALEASVRQHELAKLAVTNLLHRLVSSQEDERARIARDLHDHLGQQLTALRLTLERCRQQGSAAGVGADEITSALELTDRLDRDVDFLAWELRPAVLDEFGLAAALPRYLSEWSSHVGVASEFRLAGFEPGQLPPDAEVAFYRVAQEALNNVSKHAHATRVDVVLAAAGGQAVLVIEDDGTGFELAHDNTVGAGLGLASMRERAALVGAALEIESTLEKGTSVFLRRPITGDQGEARGREE